MTTFSCRCAGLRVRSTGASSRRVIPIAIALGVLLPSMAAPIGTTVAAPQKTFDVTQYGATGKRGDNATKAIQAAIDASTAVGGGVVYVPPGEYTTGAIELKDNVNLHVEAGATLFLSQDRADFSGGARAMINSNGARNIAVTGRGTLDGLAQYVYVDMRDRDPEIDEAREIARLAGVPLKRYYRTGMQAYMFVLNDSTDVRLEDITIINSPLWNVRLNQCDRVFIRGVHIYSDLDKGVNSDGIDLVSSRNVLISDSIVVTADDAIVIKTQARGGGPARPVENVTVTNCILTSSSTPMMIGTETEADVRHVVFSNSVIRDSNKAFGINVQDGGTVSDVIFRNITMDSRRRDWNWWGDAETFKFVLKKRSAQSKLGAIRDVVIDNVISHARGTSSLTGHADRPLENITISNLQMFMDAENTPDKRATDAIRVSGVNGLTIHNVSVSWSEEKTEEKWRSALYLKDVTRLDVDRFSGRQGLKTGKAPVVVLENVADGVLRNLRATEGSGTFLEFRGAGTRNLWVHSNELRKAARPAAFVAGARRNLIDLR
jgi:polygalacturonase